MSYKDLKKGAFSFIVSAISFVPLIVFMLYTRIRGLVSLDPLARATGCSTAWGEPFYAGAILAVIAIGFQWAAGLILDRLMLGANVFLLTAASLFLCNINPCLYFLGAYKGAFFIGCVLLVGIVTTFATKSGFVGVANAHPHAVRSHSLTLLAATAVAFVWAILTNSYGLLVSAIIPFIGLRILTGKLQQKMKHS